jgi:type II secretory ATPase GspE/PulE/Tfp pilus assembly ATPase PilB-like protein
LNGRRVCTFPTLRSERTVVRLFGGARRYQHLADSGLPPDMLEPLRRLLGETSGAILVSGLAGRGKAKRPNGRGYCDGFRDATTLPMWG